MYALYKALFGKPNDSEASEAEHTGDQEEKKQENVTKPKMQCDSCGEILDMMDLSALDHECTPNGASAAHSDITSQVEGIKISQHTGTNPDVDENVEEKLERDQKASKGLNSTKPKIQSNPASHSDITSQVEGYKIDQDTEVNPNVNEGTKEKREREQEDSTEPKMLSYAGALGVKNPSPLVHKWATSGASGAQSNITSKVEDHDAEGDLHVDEGIKEQWEREQKALKQQMILDDVDDWAKFHITTKNSKDHQGRRPLQYVGGVDISFVKGDNVNACAALVVVKLPTLQVVYQDLSMVTLTAPYIPGFLAFREADFLVEKVEKLRRENPQFVPQVIMVDGNGILHPREFGLACQLGVLLDIPALGVAKKLFQVDGLEKNDKHKQKILKLEKGGDTFPLIGDSGKTLGLALRSCNGSTNPIYISQGHKLSLQTALWVTNMCCKHRIPEPTRQADLRSRDYLQRNFKPAD